LVDRARSIAYVLSQEAAVSAQYGVSPEIWNLIGIATAAEPDRFDIRRTHNRHLAFGADAHVCIGSTLARLEASVCLAAMIQRFPNMAASSPTVEWTNNMAFRGLRSLPIAV
jgi:hypothetical protein